MTERWRRKLDAIGRLEPDPGALRSRLGGPRRPDPRAAARPIVAGAVAIGLAVGSFAVLRTTFGGSERAFGPSGSPAASASPGGTSLDPATICDIPSYDPDVAIVGDRYGWLAEGSEGRQFPLALLEAPGEPATTIQGPAADELRRFLARAEARNAPADGWRAIADSDAEVVYASPADGDSDWWIVRFEADDEAWRAVDFHLADQHQTPAQLGRGLHLEWSGEVVFDEGRWDSTLSLTNERDAAWTVGEDGYELWGHAHVFDPETGAEVGHAAQSVGSWTSSPELAPAASVRLPLSLGGALAELGSDRSYEVVACLPELGLASPVGRLRVGTNTTVRTVQVMTYRFTGASMEALGGGRLTAPNGCLGVVNGTADRPTYLLWPDGHALVTRDAEIATLIDPVGREVARLGEQVSLGGGYVGLEHIEDGTIGGVPEPCRRGGEGYFVTSGIADAG